jgi:hypothetical protein
MRKVWTKGPRVVSPQLKGKNGGPHVDQQVMLTLIPKGVAA